MIDPDALLNDLKPQVRALENDLRERTGEPRFAGPLTTEWEVAVRRSRTAATYETWLEDQITQSAVAWVLSTVFLRFCEDNQLIDDVFLSGRGERLDLAKERQYLFFEQPDNASKTDREWIEEGLKAMAKASPVAAGLFDRDHNPMWRLTPSLEGAKALIDFWRRARPAQPEDETDAATVPVHDFTDPDWDTRFLGNLYQDLSEHAKKKYALLQTPEFVEEFILGLTLDEAIDEFGLDPEPPEACPEELNLPRGLRVIDPTCGSGHFLLGAFHHIFEKLSARPHEDKWDLVHRALYSVHGVDKNPFAVAIARFRMLIAAMQAGEVKKLSDAPDFTLNIAVGDSLIHGRGGPDLDQGRFEFSDTGELLDPEPVFTYATEDVSDYVKTVDLLGVGSYHVVVGNPPYIQVRDKTENQNYRYYKSCSGTYALSVPFAERFFQLAIRAGQNHRGAGYIGQITANSFMKREFGKKLVEEFFPTIRLTHVIDTSGAHIPDHGTPTVILVGRRVYPQNETIRAVLGIRSEPSLPSDPAQGRVWRAIADNIEKSGSSNEWVSVTDFSRAQLTHHPWRLGGGGVGDLLATIEENSHCQLEEAVVPPIGRSIRVGADEAFMRPPSFVLRKGINPQALKTLAIGESIRDWSTNHLNRILYPYGTPSTNEEIQHELWPWREVLARRRTFQGNMRDAGLQWYEYMQHTPSAYSTSLSIVFAFVATHNHLTLERGGSAFNRSAPIIKLAEGASEDDHLKLLSILNSSIACFWLKQVSQPKGGSGIGRGVQDEPWEDRYEFTGKKLEKLPIPNASALETSRTIDAISQSTPINLTIFLQNQECVNKEALRDAHSHWTSDRQKMIAFQEELDWEVYRLYGLLTEEEAAELVADSDSVPGIKLGERAFEIVLARKMAAGEVETQWFARHGSTPITEIPEHWPEAYRRVVEKRIEMIEKRPQTIGLIERPEYKRRWASEPWEKKEKDALRGWLLDRCEARELWFAADDSGSESPKAMTVGRLADRLQDDADFVSVARLYAGEDVALIDVLTEVLDAEHVPFIPALRYKDPGLRKRAQWEETWRLQRQEDETGERLDIKVPPKYTSADFVKNSYWRNRGKLDVPKERFISYPGASPDGDKTLLLGWAGWDHAEQARALATLVDERTTRDGWELERLMRLLVGLDEVLPWVKQWHGDIDPMTGLSPAVAYEGYLQEQLERHGLPREELAKWRPPAKQKGGRAAGKKKAAE